MYHAETRVTKVEGFHLDFSVKLEPGSCQEIYLLFMTCYHHMDMQDASGMGWRKGMREEYLSAYNKVKNGGPHHNSSVDEV